jgi:two-component system, LytTR family, response regulator
MDPIKLLLIDKNNDSIERMKDMIDGLPSFQLIGTCANGEELIEEVFLKKPDLVLTCIQMPVKNGIDAIKACLTFNPHLKFIFITGYDEYAIEAFQMAAVDFIVKPVSKERLYKALEKAKNLIYFEKTNVIEVNSLENQEKKLSIREQKSIRYINFEDIYFIEKMERGCLVYSKKGIYKTKETIKRILERLDDSFYLSHRAFIINLKQVSYITPRNETYFVYFQDYPKEASISKLKINEVREKIEKLLK